MTSAIGDAKGIDLNTASAEELDRVGGLGQDRVHRIIENRPFRSGTTSGRWRGFGGTPVDDLRQAGATSAPRAALHASPELLSLSSGRSARGGGRRHKGQAMADKINLNTASANELDKIPNLGRECAERIVQERERRGGFKSIDELDQIGGFGAEAIRNLKQHATV